MKLSFSREIISLQLTTSCSKKTQSLRGYTKCEVYKISTVICENMSNRAADTF